MLAIGAGTLLVVCCAGFLLRGWAKQLGRLIASESQLAKSSRELKAAKDRLDAAMNNVPQGLCMFDADMRLTVANAGYLNMYGLSPAEVAPGCPLRDILQRRIANGNFSTDIDCYMADLRAQLDLGKPFRAITRLQDGRVISVQNQPASGGGWVAIHEDITERQRAEAQIAHMARHDALTDLPNRAYFSEEMDKLLARLREGGAPFNVFLFDLDLFKTVNDSLGHPIGDELLKAIAGRLGGATLGRLHGRAVRGRRVRDPPGGGGRSAGKRGRRWRSGCKRRCASPTRSRAIRSSSESASASRSPRSTERARSSC